MRRVERQGVAFLVLVAYVSGAIVAAAVTRPEGTVEEAVLFPGAFYLAAVGALVQFAEIAAIGTEAMGALYAVLGYVAWWLGAYLVGVRTFVIAREEFKAIALAYAGILGVGAGLLALAGGFAGAAGVFDAPLSTRALVGTGVLGMVVVLLSGAWISKVRSARFGWQSRALVYGDTAVEVLAYLLLLAGLGLLVVAFVMEVSAQFLVLTSMGVVVAAVSVSIPTGRSRGGAGTEWG